MLETTPSSSESALPVTLLLQFSYLQILDFLTTIAFLLNGVREGNPFVRWCVGVAPNPFTGLLLIKILALALGLYCWRMRKARVLMRMNLLFALLVAWNLMALIIGSVHH